MADGDFRWCETCGDRVDAEIVDGCRHFDCKMKNTVVDTSDQLHQILGEALRAAKSSGERGK